MSRLDRTHVGTRHHHLAHDGVAEFDDRVDEDALGMLYDFFLGGDVRHREQLGLAHSRRAGRSAAELLGEPHKCVRQHPDRPEANRRRRRREQRTEPIGRDSAPHSSSGSPRRGRRSRRSRTRVRRRRPSCRTSALRADPPGSLSPAGRRAPSTRTPFRKFSGCSTSRTSWRAPRWWSSSSASAFALLVRTRLVSARARTDEMAKQHHDDHEQDDVAGSELGRGGEHYG